MSPKLTTRKLRWSLCEPCTRDISIDSPRVTICPVTQSSEQKGRAFRIPASRKKIHQAARAWNAKPTSLEDATQRNPDGCPVVLYLLHSLSHSAAARGRTYKHNFGRYSLFRPVSILPRGPRPFYQQEPHVSASSNERAALHVHEPRKLHGRVTSSAFCFFCAVEISVFFEKAVTVWLRDVHFARSQEWPSLRPIAS
jgi:hypothetical protein